MAACFNSCAQVREKPLLNAPPRPGITLDYDRQMLSVTHPLLGAKPLMINCMEAYCKKGSTHRTWDQTTIAQQNRIISKSPHEIKVKTSLASGVEVAHRFAVVADEILFEATFTNLTSQPVDLEWMQPCIRLHDFVGIGCFSADNTALLATAWTHVQELFQGVIVCIHADPRIGGLAPRQTKHIWGKLYIIPNDTHELLRRYRRDFQTP
jgi:hypothetical protein